MADENTMLRGCRTTCTPLPEDPVPGITDLFGPETEEAGLVDGRCRDPVPL